MRKFSFRVGLRVLIDGAVHRLQGKTPDGSWQLVDCQTNFLSIATRDVLLAKYAAGQLKPEDRQLASGSASSRPLPDPEPIDDMPESDRRRVNFKADFLAAMAARETSGWHSRPDGGDQSEFDRALAEESRRLGRVRPVSPSTYYRWTNELALNGDVADLRGRYAARGHDQISTDVREIVMDEMRNAIVEAYEDKTVGDLATVSMSTLISNIDSQIVAENERRACTNAVALREGRSGDVERLLVAPRSRATYYAHWNKFPAYDRRVATHGKAKARADFRERRGHRAPDACLDVCEYDEVKLPMAFFDEWYQLPLGRAWLSWYLDAYSFLPVGIHLGFTGASDLAILSAARSACLPKLYVQEEYREIRNGFPAAGIMRLTTYDNALSHHAATVKSMSRDLNTEYRFAPAYTPWFKPLVEASFAMLNRKLLKEMPGFILKGVDRRDYDPAFHGCIGVRHFMQILWKWLCDVYLIHPQGPLKVKPLDRWLEGTRLVEPDFLERAADLDLVFGVLRLGRSAGRRDGRCLDHRGAIFEGEWYHSEELHELRKLHGDNLKVSIKFNPADLGHIRVRLAPGEPWAKAQALNFEYMHGRSLEQHKVCRSLGRRRYGADDVTAWMAGERELRDMIAESVEAGRLASAAATAARLAGLGSHHVTNALDHDGRLGPLAGPFSGMPLAPPKPASTPLRLSASLPMLPAGQPPGFSNLPDLDADFSLGD